MDIALITFSELPDLAADDRLLLVELEARGLTVAPLVWDDPGVDWSGPTVCVIRETWDYHLRLHAFLAWVDRVEHQTILLNSPQFVRWNAHKGYLRDLESLGIPIVPTVWLEAGAHADFRTLMSQTGWERAVIKPTVSASAFETRLFSAQEDDQAQAHIDRLLVARDLMLQPFLRSVQAYGERSVIFIDGEHTHAARRAEPFMGDGIERESRPAEATQEEIDFASRVLRVLPETPLYARVDVAPDDEGHLRLMELELIEPSLFFQFSPLAVERMAGGIERRLRAHTGRS
jgi:hypothetical protein